MSLRHRGQPGTVPPNCGHCSWRLRAGAEPSPSRCEEIPCDVSDNHEPNLLRGRGLRWGCSAWRGGRGGPVAALAAGTGVLSGFGP